jgi:dihydroorotate dehydrogenase electron transfer subunit
MDLTGFRKRIYHLCREPGKAFLPERFLAILISMATGSAEILEMGLDGSSIFAVLVLPDVLRPAAGQYLLAFCAELGDLLPAPLFPGSLPSDEMTFAGPLPLNWSAGTRLNVRGPLGHGFHLPPEARRIGLAALGPGAGVLLPLAYTALLAGAEVALYASAIPSELPSSVEVLPTEELPEARQWADYIAADLPRELLPSLRKQFGLRPHEYLPGASEALVRVPMPCGGIAECGVCAVQVASGYRLGCKDGPVFPLNQVIGNE